MQRNKIIIICATLIILVSGFIAASKYYGKVETERLSFMAKENFALFVRPESVKIGRSTAKVILTEFMDPECESCREFYPMIKTLIREFNGEVQLVVRYIPFHPNSVLAIRIIEAARMQQRYWETLEVLFKYQPVWGSHHNPKPEVIWTSLKEVDLDLDRLKIDMDKPEISKIIEQDLADARALDIRGTPTFFINGEPVTNFGYPQLKLKLQQAIDQTR